jgi:hypothetical protein
MADGSAGHKMLTERSESNGWASADCQAITVFVQSASPSG